MKEPYEALTENIKLNKAEDRIKAYNCDVRDLPRGLKDSLYDVVFMNPPFYQTDKSVVTDKENVLTARFNEKGSLEDFISCASARTRMSSGYTVMCMAPARLPECMELFGKYKLAPSRLISVHASAEKDAFLFLLAGKKGSPNTEFKVLPPLYMDSERINKIYISQMEELCEELEDVEMKIAQNRYVNRCIGRLPHDEREIIEAFTRKDITYERASRDLHMTRNTLYKLQKRALEMLIGIYNGHAA